MLCKRHHHSSPDFSSCKTETLSPLNNNSAFPSPRALATTILVSVSDLISLITSVQFSSVAQSCLNLCDPVDCSTPGFHGHHQLPDLTQTHVHRVGDAIQPFHPLSSPSLPTFNLSQHQGLFQSVSSSHQVAKVLEFHLQHQSFQ